MQLGSCRIYLNISLLQTRTHATQRSASRQNFRNDCDRTGELFWMGRLGPAYKNQLLYQQPQHWQFSKVFTQNTLGKKKGGGFVY